jgi:hypothetical protein
VKAEIDQSVVHCCAFGIRGGGEVDRGGEIGDGHLV